MTVNHTTKNGPKTGPKTGIVKTDPTLLISLEGETLIDYLKYLIIFYFKGFSINNFLFVRFLFTPTETLSYFESINLVNQITALCLYTR